MSKKWDPLFRAFAATAAHSAFVPTTDIPTDNPEFHSNLSYTVLPGAIPSIVRNARAAVEPHDFTNAADVALKVGRIAQLTAGEVSARYRSAVWDDTALSPHAVPVGGSGGLAIFHRKVLPSPADAFELHVALATSHTEAFVRMLTTRYGRRTAIDICRASLCPPPPVVYAPDLAARRTRVSSNALPAGVSPHTIKPFVIFDAEVLRLATTQAVVEPNEIIAAAAAGGVVVTPDGRLLPSGDQYHNEQVTSEAQAAARTAQLHQAHHSDGADGVHSDERGAGSGRTLSGAGSGAAAAVAALRLRAAAAANPSDTTTAALAAVATAAAAAASGRPAWESLLADVHGAEDGDHGVPPRVGEGADGSAVALRVSGADGLATTHQHRYQQLLRHLPKATRTALISGHVSRRACGVGSALLASVVGDSDVLDAAKLIIMTLPMPDTAHVMLCDLVARNIAATVVIAVPDAGAVRAMADAMYPLTSLKLSSSRLLILPDGSAVGGGGAFGGLGGSGGHHWGHGGAFGSGGKQLDPRRRVTVAELRAQHNSVAATRMAAALEVAGEDGHAYVDYDGSIVAMRRVAPRGNLPTLGGVEESRWERIDTISGDVINNAAEADVVRMRVGMVDVEVMAFAETMLRYPAAADVVVVTPRTSMCGAYGRVPRLKSSYTVASGVRWSYGVRESLSNGEALVKRDAFGVPVGVICLDSHSVDPQETDAAAAAFAVAVGYRVHKERLLLPGGDHATYTEGGYAAVLLPRPRRSARVLAAERPLQAVEAAQLEDLRAAADSRGDRSSASGIARYSKSVGGASAAGGTVGLGRAGLRIDPTVRTAASKARAAAAAASPVARSLATFHAAENHQRALHRDPAWIAQQPGASPGLRARWNVDDPYFWTKWVDASNLRGVAKMRRATSRSVLRHRHLDFGPANLWAPRTGMYQTQALAPALAQKGVVTRRR